MVAERLEPHGSQKIEGGYGCSAGEHNNNRNNVSSREKAEVRGRDVSRIAKADDIYFDGVRRQCPITRSAPYRYICLAVARETRLAGNILEKKAPS